ncbi:MAG: cytidylate kinase-like family protein [Armatimonadota bacterium]
MIITVSRQAATNGGLIGRLVAKRLGLRVYDREVVDEIARRMQVDPHLVDRFDEVNMSPVQSILMEWRNSINESIYQRHLREALERIREEGDAVIIGRGGNFILRGPDCLHVRIVAPLDLRIGIYRTVYPEVTEREARQRINAEDREKARFVRTQFRAAIDDPVQYDLLLNVGSITPELAQELIEHAAKARAGQTTPPAPEALLPEHVRIMARHRRPARPGVVEQYRFEP